MTQMEVQTTERERSSRRDWINLLIRSSASAGLLASTLRAQEHVHEAYVAQLNEGTGSSWTPAFLSREQNETLIVLGEAIIPGSRDANCNRIIDLVLSIDLEKNKTEALNALAAFDAAARKDYGKPLSSLDPSGLHKLLVNASSSESSLWPAFSLLKEWLAATYWSSKNGLQEVGWTGRLAWTKFDGCPHGANNHA